MTKLFRDERGFTTTSMVLSLLIALALVFTGAQIYRINSASAEAQDVADAAALAAENQVAEFMIVARFCDATVLTLSLSGIAACGLGVVALCTPVTATLSKGLISAGKQIIEMRNKFAERARKALDKLQEALPYFSAACAAATAHANDGDSSGSRYLGVALLVPGKGEPTSADVGDKADELVDDVEGRADDIREQAKEAEEAAKEAEEAKLAAFKHDCGNDPDYCMYERAKKLTGLSGGDNPLFKSVDAWSFSIALERARHYYAYRANNETPTGSSSGDLARAHLRVDFYKYASSLLNSKGYVHESSDSFDANFPRLPKNTSEMKGTELYTNNHYLITEEPVDEGATLPVMHAWPGCPGATGASGGYSSISYMESANLATCPVCQFTAASMGKVAAASTSIENGFEYHYEAVAREADRYKAAIERAEPAKQAVKSGVGELFDELVEALKEAIGERIEVSPPGKYGAIAFVVNTGSASTAGGFASRFAAAGQLGPRVAISAATLLDEGSDEGKTAINSLLDGLKQDGGVAVGATGMVLDLWSWLLSAYSNGIDALVKGVETALDSMPLMSVSGLGKWAAGKLSDLVDDIGLQPAKLEALKPVLVNSAHVAAKGGSGLSSGLVSVKKQVIAHPLSSTSLFASLLSDAEKTAIGQVEGIGDSIEIASIELFGPSGPSLPITIPVPAEAKSYGVGAIQGLFDQIRSIYARTTGVRAWE